MAKRHVPPSRKKYVEQNPSLTIRLTRPIRRTLEKIAKGSNMSFAEILRDSFEGATKSYDMGFEDAKKEFKISYTCSVCYKEITMFPGSETHESIIEFLFGEGWAHGTCINSKD